MGGGHALDHAQRHRDVVAQAAAGILVGPAGADAHDVDVDRLREIGPDRGDRHHGTVDHREVQAVAQDLVRRLCRGRGRVFQADAVLAHQGLGFVVELVAAFLALRLAEVDGEELELARQGARHLVDGGGKLRGNSVSVELDDLVRSHAGHCTDCSGAIR